MDQPSDYELLELRESASTSPSPFEACDPRLTPGICDGRRDASLVYVIDPDTRFTTKADTLRSDEPLREWTRGANPGNWEPVEWAELLDGRLGPWAMVTLDRRVVALCHTPLPMSETTAEAGVWTDPGFRGLGYAAAATARWAEILRPSHRYLFYSPLVENLSSQRVTERLGARLIGWTWRADEARDEVECHVHPLSTLHR